MLTPGRNRKTYSSPRAVDGRLVGFLPSPPPPPPPRASLATAGEEGTAGREDMDDWMRFKEAGFLDEAELERKDRLALLQKIEKLENELYDYQYNMGLLLVERKEWTSRHDELSQELAEVEELYKREQSSHLIAVSEAEKREDIMEEALIHEKQRVADLEKSLRELDKEQQQIRFESEKKLSEASNLVIGIEETSAEVNAKLHDATAKLAEVDCKWSELDLKMQELEAREHILHREHMSLKAEQEAHKATFYQKREDLMDREKSLQEREKKLSEDRRILNEREDKANEKIKFLSETEIYLEDADKSIQSSTVTLQEKEQDVKKRLGDIIAKEEESCVLATMLKSKEEQLNERQEKLEHKENVELPKLLDEQHASLEEEIFQFNIELAERWKHLDKELRIKREEIEQCDSEINHREHKLMKRVSALDMKAEKISEEEKDIEGRFKNLEEHEKSIIADSERLEMGKKELLRERETLQSLRDEIEKIKADIAERKLDIKEASESLQTKSNDRSEHIRLQTEFKVQLEKCHRQWEMLMKEQEELKREKEKIDRDWETLDVNRASCLEGEKDFLEENIKLEELKLSEEKRLNMERDKMEEHMQRELESIKLARESFAVETEQEENNTFENLKVKHIQLLQDIETMKEDFQATLHRRQDDQEKALLAREEKFELERDRELKTINESRMNLLREKEEVESETRALKKSKQILEMNKKQLKENQQEMNRDIDQLMVMSRKLKDQRLQLSQERDDFLLVVKKLRNCDTCGEMLREFMLSDLQMPLTRDEEVLPLEQRALELSNNLVNKSYLDGSPMQASVDVSPRSFSGGPTSFLRKCASKIFRLSPGERGTVSVSSQQKWMPSAEDNLVGSGSLENKKNQQEHASVQDKAETSVQIFQDHATVMESMSSDKAEQSDRRHIPSVDGIRSPFDAQLSFIQEDRQKTAKKGVGVHKAESVLPVYPSNSARKTLMDAELISEDISVNDDSQRDSVYNGKGRRKAQRKRQHAESSQTSDYQPDESQSEGPSDSVVVSGRKKRQRTIPRDVQTPGQRRYNLRRRKISSDARAAENSADLINSGRKETDVNDDGKTADGSMVEIVPSSSLGNRKHDEDFPYSHDRQPISLEFSEQKVLEFENVDIVEGTGDATSEHRNEFDDENNTIEQFPNEDETILKKDDGYDDDSDEDLGDPGMASVGRKIWTFFTT
ncbi:hypothetical protein MLD38_004376 [Melastoma candidum]|uniref:Uncharacterized protein n=1 Tax=Melastoma candidum TaxID=119954 RepID=A0ACB9S4Z8_9MYRT|nr:hypothetical protein MLD38_004376 [Melastoma candidum]